MVRGAEGPQVVRRESRQDTGFSAHSLWAIAHTATNLYIHLYDAFAQTAPIYIHTSIHSRISESKYIIMSRCEHINICLMRSCRQPLSIYMSISI